MLDIRDYEAMTMLDLQDSEREFLSLRLDELRTSFCVLEQIDTDNVLPLVSVLNTRNIMREDVMKKPFSRDEILANAPEQCDGCFLVPGTLG